MSRTATSHDARLREVLGTNVRATVDRIVATFERATPSDVESGARWYGEAGTIVDSMVTATGHTRETCAAVIAHLSPRTPWARNVSGAWALLTTGEAPGCLRANIKGARRAIVAAGDGRDPLATLRGPKVRRFAANILDDRSAVTVDVWALRVALGDRAGDGAILSRVGVYDAIEHAYRLAAQRVGTDPVTVQATTWIVARNGRAG